MHQVLFKCTIIKEIILVQLILLFMMASHLFLWKQMLQKVDELNTHMWVANTTVQND